MAQMARSPCIGRKVRERLVGRWEGTVVIFGSDERGVRMVDSEMRMIY